MAIYQSVVVAVDPCKHHVTLDLVILAELPTSDSSTSYQSINTLLIVIIILPYMANSTMVLYVVMWSEFNFGSWKRARSQARSNASTSLLIRRVVFYFGKQVSAEFYLIAQRYDPLRSMETRREVAADNGRKLLLPTHHWTHRRLTNLPGYELSCCIYYKARCTVLSILVHILVCNAPAHRCTLHAFIVIESVSA
jgi:hypothetical protein